MLLQNHFLHYGYLYPVSRMKSSKAIQRIVVQNSESQRNVYTQSHSRTRPHRSLWAPQARAKDKPLHVLDGLCAPRCLEGRRRPLAYHGDRRRRRMHLHWQSTHLLERRLLHAHTSCTNKVTSSPIITNTLLAIDRVLMGTASHYDEVLRDGKCEHVCCTCTLSMLQNQKSAPIKGRHTLPGFWDR